MTQETEHFGKQKSKKIPIVSFINRSLSIATTTIPKFDPVILNLIKYVQAPLLHAADNDQVWPYPVRPEGQANLHITLSPNYAEGSKLTQVFSNCKTTFSMRRTEPK